MRETKRVFFIGFKGRIMSHRFSDLLWLPIGLVLIIVAILFTG